MRCAKCGRENPDGAKFCAACGTPLNQTVVIDDEYPYQQAPAGQGFPARPAGQEAGWRSESPGQGGPASQIPAYQAAPAPAGAGVPRRPRRRRRFVIPIVVASVVLVVGVVVALATGVFSQPKTSSTKDDTKSSQSSDAKTKDAKEDDVASPKEVLKAYVDELGEKRYELDYMWQARGESNDPWFKWVVGDGIKDDAVIGHRMADFDGDSQEELLVVRWKSPSLTIEMNEVKGNKVSVADKIDAYASEFPICGVGAFDVACDGSEGIDVQWWWHSYPMGDGHLWQLDRYTYDGSKFKKGGEASLSGTAFTNDQLDELRNTIADMGLSVEGLKQFDQNNTVGLSGLIATMYADVETSQHVVTRIVASKGDDVSSLEQLETIAKSEGDAWSDAQQLGKVVIAQKAEGVNVNYDGSQDAPQKKEGEPEKKDESGTQNENEKPSEQEAPEGQETPEGQQPPEGQEPPEGQQPPEGQEPPEGQQPPGEPASYAPEDGYVLDGTVRVHEELNASGQPFMVASIVLDSPVHYAYDYKGVVETDAQEVALANSEQDGYATWAEFDGQHIRVHVEELRGAIHDASFMKVDAIALGEIALM